MTATTDFDFDVSLKELPFFGNYTPDFTNTIDEETEVSPSAVLLVCVYTVIFGVGVIGNGSLLAALVSQQSTRVRNPLLVGLCVADLLVCACSGPLAAARPTLAPDLDVRGQPCDTIMCAILTCLECFPVSASTLSLMTLSVDRYTTVQHPRSLAGMQRKPTLMVVMVWVFAALLTIPLLVAKSFPPPAMFCSPGGCFYAEVRTGAMVCYVVLVFVVPTVTMAACHLSVRSKLCALSLTARAAHGELPLPMPLLRRPTHVIIVAGSVRTHAYECDIRPTPARKQHQPQRASSQRTRNGHRTEQQPPPKPSLLTAQQPQTSTLQSRRRLANVLVSIAAVFAGCWLPHAIGCLYAEFHRDVPKGLLQYSLLLGHAHSAINPVVYWALNHQTLRPQQQQNQQQQQQQQGCWLCPRASRFLFHFKLHDEQPPSSTNEAALGPFHPRYTRSRPFIERAAPSSHYLY